MTSITQIRLVRALQGHVKPDDFELVTVSKQSPAAGQVSVRNEWMSLDPYMRIVLAHGSEAENGPESDVPLGAAIGSVEESTDPAYPVGTRVLSNLGWRSHFVASPQDGGLTLIEDDDLPVEWHLGILGLTGITAWRGIEDVLEPNSGDVLFITGAAGAVGTVACQLAKSRGARVLASAGSDEKATWLVDELGVDAVVNYRRESMSRFLDREAPNGLDQYFDNVGGDVLNTVLKHMKVEGRVALCGAMSQYEQAIFAGPANFFTVLERSLRLQGFSAFALDPVRRDDILTKLKQYIKAGRLKSYQTIVEGLAGVPSSMAAMFESGHLGKLIVRL